MPECPECGSDVPSDGRFCSDCGVDIRAGGETGRQSSSEDRRQSQQPRQFGYPNPGNHRLLIGSVGTLGLLGLLDGLARVVSPERSAEQLLEISEDSGFAMEQGFAEQVILLSGGITILVFGFTVQNYRRGRFRKRYFWMLIGVGVLGFLFASSLFLMVLAAFGVYGLVSVMD